MSGYYYGDFVIPPNLATSADYTNWTGTAAPSNITQILRSCTRLVLKVTEGAYYDADPTTGLATDTQQLNAMRDATCAQAAAWVALNINPLTGGVVTPGTRASKKIGTAAVTYDPAEAAAAGAARAAAVQGLVPEAMQILQQNNLIGSQVWTYG